jgi:tetratricopeptide (TPR) repeat protein
VLRYVPAAARRAARLSSHREAVAQFERALRYAAGADAATVAALYDDLAAELTLLDRAEAAADAGEHALELWRAAGNRRREGDTTRRLSGILRNLCRGQDAEAAAHAAVAVLEPLTASIELAQAYANLAAQQMLTGRYEAAIETARRAQSLAGLVGAPTRSRSTPMASPIATSATWPPTRPSCAATGQGPWKRPGTGTRRWL